VPEKTSLSLERAVELIVPFLFRTLWEGLQQTKLGVKTERTSPKDECLDIPVLRQTVLADWVLTHEAAV
jgi:hypothetical protein